MPGMTVSAAARLCGVDRRTIQRSIQAGRLHLDAQHCVSREALIAAGYLDAAAPQSTTQSTPHYTPHIDAALYAAYAPQEMPQELTQVTALLALLAQLTTTIAALHQEVQELRADLRQMPQRRRSGAPQERGPLPGGVQEGVQEVPQVTPQVTPQSAPHGTPHEVRHAAAAPHHERATPQSPQAVTPHIQRIAEVAAQYNRLSLRELSQLLFDRGIYRARDRRTGEATPVNRGTLGRWLEQARHAGVL